MMKIAAGLGSAEDYEAYVRAGADEVFCGFVPELWQTKWGFGTPLNRREVCYYAVQLGAESDLEILAEQRKKYRIPVTLTFNGLQYQAEQYSVIAGILESCAEKGFDSVIIADPGLLLYLQEKGISRRMKVHVSGEIGEMNRYTLALLGTWDIDRIIFHRQIMPEEMQSMIEAERSGNRRDPEYEAFLLNERCQFHGGYCHSLHCDEMTTICRESYRLGRVRRDGEELHREEIRQKDEKLPDDAYSSKDARLTNDDITAGEADLFTGIGASGCGLCALWKLREAGVTHLKLVGRGAPAEDMIRDIRAVRKALEILENSETELQYLQEMKRLLFPNGCSGNCYYREQ